MRDKYNSVSYSNRMFLQSNQHELRDVLPHPDEEWIFSDTELTLSHLHSCKEYSIIYIVEDNAYSPNVWSVDESIYQYLQDLDD